MKYAKQLVVVFDLAARCHALIEELNNLGVQTKLSSSDPSELRSVVRSIDNRADIVFVHTDPQHLAQVITELRALVPYSGIVAASNLETPVRRAELLMAGADVCLPVQSTGAELIAIQRAQQRRADHLSVTPLVASVSDTAPKEPKLPRWFLRDNGWTLVSPEGVEMKLTYGEKFFIELLHHHSDNGVSRDQLMASKISATQNSRAVDSLISRLRRKAKQAGADLPIKSVHGWGYSFAGELIGSAPHQPLTVKNEFEASERNDEFSSSVRLTTEIMDRYHQRATLQLDALALMFQAKINANTGVQDGVDVLIYWRQKKGDLVRLTDAELRHLDTAALSWLYDCAFELLASELASWASDYSLRMSVTLSIPLRVLERNYPSLIQKTLALGLNDGRLELAVMGYEVDVNHLTTQTMLHDFAAIRVPVWLDKYVGTAENLSYLEQWEIRGVRLSYDAHDQALSRAQLKSLITMTCKLCAGLGIKTVITGVSSAADRAELIDVGADYLHGDFIALPLSRDGLLLAMASGLKATTL